MLEQFDEAAVLALRDACFSRMAPQRTPSGYPMRLAAWIVTGRRPPGV